MSILGILIIVLVILIGFIVGLFLFLKPIAAIEIQKNFYATINWRIEPISMPKELRNTKIMGLCLLGIVFMAFVYFTKKLF